MIEKHQSPTLHEVFEKQVDRKVSVQRQDIQEKLEGTPLEQLGMMFWDLNQTGKQIKGNFGENLLSFLIGFLPDTWIMFKNALIPNSTGKLTEIDVLLIGPQGIFLIEVKTWKGSFIKIDGNAEVAHNGFL